MKRLKIIVFLIIGAFLFSNVAFATQDKLDLFHFLRPRAVEERRGIPTPALDIVMEILPEEEAQRVISVFNMFDAPLVATQGNCNVEVMKRGPIGRVNLATFFLTEKNTREKLYVVQQLNPVFDPDAIDANIQALQKSQETAINNGELPETWQPVHYLNVKGSSNIIYYTRHPTNPKKQIAWRVMEFIKEGVIFDSFDEVTKYAQEEYKQAMASEGKSINEEDMKRFAAAYRLDVARSLGVAMADFRKMLEHSKMDKMALPNFHNTPRYWEQFETLLAGGQGVINPSCQKDNAPKIQLVSDLLDNPEYSERIKYLINEYRKRSNHVHLLTKEGETPIPAHNDTKINNFVFRKNPKTGKLECVCLIDLDTLQPNEPNRIPLDDLGDALRSVGNPAGEDPRDEHGERCIDKVSIDMEIMKAIIGGFLSRIEHYYGKAEAERLSRYAFHAARIYFFELGLRFFTSFLTELVEPDENGSKWSYGTYFRLRENDPIDKNLWLAEVQMRALQELEKALGPVPAPVSTRGMKASISTAAANI